MKKLSKKGVLLFAGAMALCAFVLPSVASAASWGALNSHHVLDSPNFGFTSNFAGNAAISSCTRSSFTSRVVSANTLEITTGSFGGLCTFDAAAAGRCTLTPVGTRFPWTATATATNNVQIHGVHIDWRFETIPGAAAGSCGLNGVDLTITGTLTGGSWTGNAAGALDFVNAEGLVSHSVLGNGTAMTARGTVVGTGGLTMVD